MCGIESRASSCQIEITDEIRENMVESLDEVSYRTFGQYVDDPERQNFVTKATKLRSMFK